VLAAAERLDRLGVEPTVDQRLLDLAMDGGVAGKLRGGALQVLGVKLTE
jgi:hypothetical protein